MKYNSTSDVIKKATAETLSYMDYSRSHWIKNRPNNPLERFMKEIRRRTRLFGSFPDRHSALMLITAWLFPIVRSNEVTKNILT